MTTENKTTHSPLPWQVTESIPWKIDRENWVKNIILDANEEYVTAIFHKEGKDAAETIAALIVAAVNAHDKLRNALKEAVRLFTDRVVRGGYPDECVWLEQACAMIGNEADDGQE